MDDENKEQPPIEGPLSEGQLRVLMGNLNPRRIAKRSQGGRELSFLEAWDVKATLIRVFGFGGFSAEVIDTRILEINRESDDKGTKIEVAAMCTLQLTIHSLGAVYTESAVASQKGRDVGEVADFAVKTAESDALKRAAIYLGTQFGLSLYDNGATRDVIRVVFAPGQEVLPETQPTTDNPEAEQILKDKLGASAE